MSQFETDTVVAASVDCCDMHYREHGMRSQRPQRIPDSIHCESLLRHAFGVKGEVKVLEVGCGTGANLWMMAKEGLQVYGLDSGKTAIDLAEIHLQDKWGGAVNLQQGGFTDLPYADGYFDVVVSLQHLAFNGRKRALSEIARTPKPDGEFFNYRLSDHSMMYARSGASDRLDAVNL